MSQRIMMGVAMILAAATGKAESISVDSSKVYDIDEETWAEGPKFIGAARPERAEALSPGHRPGYIGNRQGAL